MTRYIHINKYGIRITSDEILFEMFEKYFILFLHASEGLLNYLERLTQGH